MLGALLWVITAALAVWAVRQARTPRPHQVWRMLALYAIAMVFTRLAALGLRALHGELTSFGVLALTALAGLLLWVPVIWLASYGVTRRDLYWRIPLFALALIAGFTSAPYLVPALFVAPALLAFRWRSQYGTQRLFRLALYATALVVFVNLTRGPTDLTALPQGEARGILRFGLWANFVASFYGLFTALALFVAFVRDPSLGIRTVSRRLALSHWLAVLVPVLLLGGLWVFTTVIGVNNDRAQIAAREVAAEGERLRDALASALDAGPEPTPRLRALARNQAARWPRLAVWLLRDGTLEHVTADTLAGERHFKAWVDSLRVLRSSGVVMLRDGGFLGAAVRAAGDSTVAAVALVPIDSVLVRSPSRLVEAEIRIEGISRRRWRQDSLALARADSIVRMSALAAGDSMLVLAQRADSITVEKVRRVTRRFGVPDSAIRTSRREDAAKGLVITAGDDTVVMADRDSTGHSFLLEGHAQARGLIHTRRGWLIESSPISAYVPPGRVLSGLFSRSASDSFGVFAIFIVVLAGLVALLVTLFDVIMVGNMGRSITAAIHALRIGAAKLQAGDLSHRIDVRGEDDLWGVAVALNHASAGLERARELEKERDRLENELEVARQIQARLLPTGPPAIAGLEIAGLSESAREVGGDYFDHIDLGGGRVLLVIADVSGKGVPAALLMSGFRASLVSQDLRSAEAPALASRLNEFLHRSVETGKFVTCFICFLDGTSGRLVYVNAGHNPPILLRTDGTHESLTRGGMILGVLANSLFESGEATLESGDLIALYTDGVVEGANARDELWGDDRLLEALRRLRTQPARVIAQQLVDEVHTFEGERGPADDITVLIARRSG